ncbi:MAG: PUA domain-containing protein, partial [Candidatus Angelobacter sp.]
AAKALQHRQASLLVSGVTASQGEFSAGQVIAVLDPEGNIIGKGITELGSQHLAALLTSGDSRRGVLVRRENFLILSAKEPHAQRSGF